MISDNKLSERELRKWKEAEELSDKYEYEKLKSRLSKLEEEKESFFRNRMGGSKRVKQIDIEIKELKKQMSKFTQDAMGQLALMGITQDAEPQYVEFKTSEGGKEGQEKARKKEEDLKRHHKEVKLVMASPAMTYFKWEVKDADKDQHYWDRQGEYWKDLYYYWKAIFETSSDPKARKEAKPKMEEAKRKRDFAYQQFNSFITKDAKLPTDWDVGNFNSQWYVTKNGQKYKGPFSSMKAAENWLEQVRPDFEEDNDATEGGAIEQYGENKETESMPLEKEPVQAQDSKFRVIWMSGKSIANSVSQEEIVEAKNAEEAKAKIRAKDPNAWETFTQIELVKDEEVKRVQDSFETLKMLGIM